MVYLTLLFKSQCPFQFDITLLVQLERGGYTHMPTDLSYSHNTWPSAAGNVAHKICTLWATLYHFTYLGGMPT